MSLPATFLDQIRRRLAALVDDRPPSKIPPTRDQRPLDSEGDAINRLMLLKIGWTFSFLLFLTGVAPNEDHLKLLRHLLNTCAIVDMMLATMSRDKLSFTRLNRWDEAILFATISLGLRIFA